MAHTKKELEAMTTVQLVELYNKAAGKTIKKFSSRKAGLEQTVAALATKGEVRTVTNMAAKIGRPTSAYNVVLAEGKSKIQTKSLRGEILAYLRDAKDKTANTADLEIKFGKRVRGAIIKLLTVGWLKQAG